MEFQYSDPCLGRCHCGFETKKASYTCAKTAIRYCVLRIRIAYAESVWGRRVWAKMSKRIRRKGSPFFSSSSPPLLLPLFGHHSKSPIGVNGSLKALEQKGKRGREVPLFAKTEIFLLALVLAFSPHVCMVPLLCMARKEGRERGGSFFFPSFHSLPSSSLSIGDRCRPT